jgi:hypothetical protein
MRALPLVGALLVGLALCGTAAAQNVSNLYQSNYASTATSTNLYQQTYGRTIGNQQSPPPNNFIGTLVLGGGFSPKSLFERFQSPAPRPSFAPLPAIPNPDTQKAAYLKAFGIRPLQ